MKSTARLDFAWDRMETEESLRKKLEDETSPQWVSVADWLLREARTDQVWPFLSLKKVAQHFDEIAPQLGRRRLVWEHLLSAAHELGRL